MSSVPAADFFARFAAAADRCGDRPAIGVPGPDGPTIRTYTALREEALLLAGALVARGLRPGDRCALVAPNSARWCVAWLAIVAAGGVVMPLDPGLDAERLEAQLRDGAPRVIVAGGAPVELVRELLGRGAGPPQRPPLSAEFLSLDDPSDLGPPSPLTPLARTPDDPVLLLYTSGTTGTPKGVLLTQRSVLTVVDALSAQLGVTASDRALGVLPLYHLLAQLTTILVPLAHGGSVWLLSAPAPADVLRALAEDGITMFCCVPRFFYLVHDRVRAQVAAKGRLTGVVFALLLALNGLLRRVGLNGGKRLFGAVHAVFGPDMRYLISGGSRFEPAVARDFERLGFDLLQGYGLTECTASATFTPPARNRVGTVGQPIAGVEVRILAPDADGIGEVAVRGPNLMVGYFNRPDATAAAIHDGWLHTGDLGRIDADGTLSITGRANDLVVLSSGKNVHPEELEAAYGRAAVVKELCVLGRTPPAGVGTELYAVIVPDMDAVRAAGEPAADAVRRAMEEVAATLPPHLRIRGWELRAAPLPRTATLKLQRHAVTTGTAASTARAWSAEDEAWAAANAELLAMIPAQQGGARGRRVHPADDLDLDLGLDSLGRLELAHRLQARAGVELPERAVGEVRTVRELLALIAAGSRSASSAGDMWTRLTTSGATVPAPPWVVTRPLYGLVRGLASVILRVEVSGLEHLPAGPVILCANHQSILDGVLLTALLPAPRRAALVHVSKPAWFGGGFGRAVAHRFAVLLADTGGDVVGSLQACARALRQGRSLLVFAEGTRSRDGALGPFRRGAGVLAASAGAPIVPVAIDGTGVAWPRGSYLRPAKVRVAFGAPIVVDGVTPDAAERATEAAHAAVAALLTQTRIAAARPAA